MAVFLFVVLIIVIILLFQDVGIGIVSPVAVFGLVMVWVVGWRRGQQLYRSFYAEELFRVEMEAEEAEKKQKEEKKEGKTLEETLELRTYVLKWESIQKDNPDFYVGLAADGIGRLYDMLSTRR